MLGKHIEESRGHCSTRSHYYIRRWYKGTFLLQRLNTPLGKITIKCLKLDTTYVPVIMKRFIIT